MTLNDRSCPPATSGRVPTKRAGLYDELAEAADPEGLAYYGRRSRAVPTELLPLAEGHLVLAYRGGRSQSWHVWLPSLTPVPGSVLPPPSIQNGAVLLAYDRRDGHRCHLCGRPTSRAWNAPALWPSLDHLTPRVFGGTDYPSNIKTSHQHCNKARGARPLPCGTRA